MHQAAAADPDGTPQSKARMADFMAGLPDPPEDGGLEEEEERGGQGQEEEAQPRSATVRRPQTPPLPTARTLWPSQKGSLLPHSTQMRRRRCETALPKRGAADVCLSSCSPLARLFASSTAGREPLRALRRLQRSKARLYLPARGRRHRVLC